MTDQKGIEGDNNINTVNSNNQHGKSDQCNRDDDSAIKVKHKRRRSILAKTIINYKIKSKEDNDFLSLILNAFPEQNTSDPNRRGSTKNKRHPSATWESLLLWNEIKKLEVSEPNVSTKKVKHIFNTSQKLNNYWIRGFNFSDSSDAKEMKKISKQNEKIQMCTFDIIKKQRVNDIKNLENKNIFLPGQTRPSRLKGKQEKWIFNVDEIWMSFKKKKEEKWQQKLKKMAEAIDMINGMKTENISSDKANKVSIPNWTKITQLLKVSRLNFEGCDTDSSDWECITSIRKKLLINDHKVFKIWRKIGPSSFWTRKLRVGTVKKYNAWNGNFFGLA